MICVKLGKKNKKKILRAVWDVPAKKHSQFSPMIEWNQAGLAELFGRQIPKVSYHFILFLILEHKWP